MNLSLDAQRFEQDKALMRLCFLRPVIWRALLGNEWWDRRGEFPIYDSRWPHDDRPSPEDAYVAYMNVLTW